MKNYYHKQWYYQKLYNLPQGRYIIQFKKNIIDYSICSNNCPFLDINFLVTNMLVKTFK